MLVQNGIVEVALLVGTEVEHFWGDVVVGRTIVAESRAKMRALLVSSCLATWVVVQSTLAGFGQRTEVLEVVVVSLVWVLLERFAQRRSFNSNWGA